MAASRHRIARFLADSLPIWEPIAPPRSTFYREEFQKCQQCLEEQREYFSEAAVQDVEQALCKVLGQLDRLCAGDDADQVVGRLLQQLHLVTGASAWTDPRQVH